MFTLNSIGDAVLRPDIAGKGTYLNAMAEAMTGWRREEAVDQPNAEVFRIIDGCVLIRRDGFEWDIEDSAADHFPCCKRGPQPCRAERPGPLITILIRICPIA